MDERIQVILQNSINDFIETGEPITSNRLFGHYNFGIKPAMIRRELNKLDRLGFLSQIHPSGGRVPTVKAYQFFVRHLSDQELLAAEYISFARKLLKLIKQREFDVFTDRVARYLASFNIFYEPQEDLVEDSGLVELLRKLDLAKEELLRSVSDIEFLDKKLRMVSRRWEKSNQWPRVYIGQSPVTSSDYLSVIVARINYDGRHFYLFNVGPVHMNYKKSLGLIKSLLKCVSK